MLAAIVVSNLDDGQVDVTHTAPGTLRQAIWDANHNTEADTITFQSGLSGTIQLDYGELVIDTLEDVSITGLVNAMGENVITIDAQDQSRIFLLAGSATNRNASIANLNLINGNTSSVGGGIYLVDGDLTLDSVSIIDCFADDSGGGIYATVTGGESLTLSNVRVAENSAVSQGGGIYLHVEDEESQVLIDQSIVEGNSTPFGDGFGHHDGGGIFVSNGYPAGGGPVVDPGVVVISRSRIANNVAGRIAPIEDNNDRFAGSGSGGGIAARTVLHGASLGEPTIRILIQDCEISGNTGTDNGGGVFLTTIFFDPDYNTSAQIINSTISGNQATTGGGIYFGGRLANIYGSHPNQIFLRHSTVTGNTAGGLNGPSTPGYSSKGGGGIFLAEGLVGLGEPAYLFPVTIEHSIISGNAHVCDAFNECDYRWTYHAPDIGSGIERTLPIFPNDPPVKEVFLRASYTIVGDSTGPLAGGVDPFGYEDYKLDLAGTGNKVDVDAKLAPLADNGGGFELPDGSHLRTHVLYSDSPAIDAGDPNLTTSNYPQVDGSDLTTDQRGTGYNRIFDFFSGNNSQIDIGAFELQPPPGDDCDADFDGDGDVDGRDFLTWQRNFGLTGQTDNSNGDANGDEVVDGEDLICWRDNYGLGASGAILGDFDDNEMVDANDLAAMLENFGMESGATLADGDADGDGDVDAADFVSWQIRYGEESHSYEWLESALLFDPDDLENGQIIVTNQTDDNDGNYSLGDLSLREALLLAATTSHTDHIVFANHTLGTLALTEGQLNVDTDVQIHGPGADILTIDAQDNSRVFNITSATAVLDVTINGLTITGGKTSSNGFGGGIYNTENLTLEKVNIVDNETHGSGRGGGLYSTGGNVVIQASSLDLNDAYTGGGARISLGSSNTATIVDSTFSNNDATGSSGGGLLLEGTGDALITNSTFSDNEAWTYGGGIRVNDDVDVELINSTVYDNYANTREGGVSSQGTSSTLVHNSIMAGNGDGDAGTSQDDATGTISSSSSYNLVGLTNLSFFNNELNNNNVIGSADPGLAPLGNYGGPTQTHALFEGSDAINAGSDTIALTTYGLAYDQRGEGKLRKVGTQVDIGAYETGNDYSLLVTTSSDESNSGYEADDLSLREALELTDLLAGRATIAFDESVTNIIVGPELVIDKDLTIAGPGANLLTLDGNNEDRVFNVEDSVNDALISGLTITGGNAGSGFGGGIYSSGDLTLNNISLEDNAAAKGAGIYQNGGSLSIAGSTLSGYDANQGGGLFSNMVDLQVVNSTISGNTASTHGGGVYLYHQDEAFPKFVNVTVTLNTVSTGGSGAGIYIYSPFDGRVSLYNSIVAGNSITGGSASDVYGLFKSDSSHNLIGAVDYSMGLTGNGTLYGYAMSPYDAELDDLNYYGGPTRTHRLLSTSDARDAGDNSFVSAYDLDFDQRGVDRIADLDIDMVDIGAVELAFEEL